ncbi:MAG: F0F1 ATP synthase subunit epsilon [Photobacterium sp.]|nr:F0F1 ATP synthase subunit epsilon [Photobacterium sp.]MDX1301262.1 F0F1 ATP synthase subunit epsilon [Photobacterium sp.]
MKAFRLQLQDATHSEEIADVSSFVGEDASGSFGIQADHARFMTIMSIGITKYRIGSGRWKYLAVPGGVIYFHHNILTLCTYRYLLDDDYMRLSQALQQQLLAEEEMLQKLKESLHHMEEEVFKRFWEIGKKESV